MASWKSQGPGPFHDEYRLMVHPVILGSGKRLFRDGSEKKVLRLVETKTFSSGVVVLSYQPARQ